MYPISLTSLPKSAIKRFIYLIIFTAGIFSFQSTYSINDIFRAGAHHSAMGYSSIGVYDVWSNYNNQAGLGFMNEIEIGLHHEQRFKLEEYSQHSMAIALPTPAGTFGINATYFGFEKYYESKLGVALGKSFTDKFSAGLQFDYLFNYLQEYESGGNFTFEAGIVAQPVNNVFLDFHWYNPIHATITKNSPEEYPSVITTGIGVILDDVLILSTKFEKFNAEKLNTRIGLSYLLKENISLSTGYTTSYKTLSFGLGYYVQSFKFDLALSNYYSLGFVPHVSLSYAF